MNFTLATIFQIHFWNYFCDRQFILSSIIAVIVFVPFCMFLYRWYKDNSSFRLDEGKFKRMAIAVLVAGWMIYFIGFFEKGTMYSPLALIFRPLLSSLEMFVSHSDLLEVNERLKENALYMSFFSLIHFTAVAMSAVFVIHYLGARLSSLIRFHHAKKREIKNLYVFFGVDENSMMLAKDIHKMDVDNEDAIVFVELPVDEDVNEDRISFERLFAHFSYRRELLDMVNDCKAILKRSSYLKANVSLPSEENNKKTDKDDILKNLQINKLMQKSEKTYLMILSENEKANVKLAHKLIEFNSLKGDAEILCHARRDKINTLFEGETKLGRTNTELGGKSEKSVTIRMIDTSFLAVHSLKVHKDKKKSLNEKRIIDCFDCYPVNYIDCHEGLATSDLTAMIIGFGEIGQDALNFIYEFGQFPYADETVEHLHCLAIDRDMDSLKADYLTNAPEMDTPTSGIQYLAMDIHSQQFWQKMAELIGQLNYIIITLNDDKDSLELALRINEFAIRHRKSVGNDGHLDKFGVFVRIKNKDNDIRMEMVNNLSGFNITMFGMMRDLFKKDIIIDSDYEVMGAEFYKSYVLTQKSKSDDSINGGYNVVHKRRLNDERLKIKEKFISYDSSLINRMVNISLERKEGQDRSNAYHLYTKMRLIQATDSNQPIVKEIKQILKEIEECKPEEIQTLILEWMKKPFFLHLSQCEHKRWNASHRALGYTLMMKSNYESKDNKLGTCDILKRQHACLVPWEQLDSLDKNCNYQIYDGAVVLTTFAIALNNYLKKTK